MQECLFIDVYEENYGNESVEIKRADEDYRLSNKEKEEYIKHKLALLSVNFELAKIIDENKILMGFYGKSLYPSAMLDEESF